MERKGLGHPDTICDALAKQTCVRLCRYYHDRFDRILHHNVDKVLLVGGRSDASFGGGTVVEPIEIYIAGCATKEFLGTPIPVDEIATEACRDWLRENLRGIDVERDIRLVARLRPGSSELTQVFTGADAVPHANDTACGVGFAPLTDLERAVQQVERRLNAPETKRAHPEIGEDIKVMGTREGESINLTIGCAFVGRFISDIHDYVDKKTIAKELAIAAAREVTELHVRAAINAADDEASGNVFLTVTGTSAEAGDDGEAGRGNRVSGLITPYRPMTIESVAGKNPVSHAGKLYNLLADRIAVAITKHVPDVADVECVLVSEIGRVIADPRIVDLRLAIDGDEIGRAVKDRVTDIVRAELEHIIDLRDAFLESRLALF